MKTKLLVILSTIICFGLGAWLTVVLLRDGIWIGVIFLWMGVLAVWAESVNLIIHPGGKKKE